MFDEADKERAKKSSRGAGAVGKDAKVPKIVKDYALKSHKILDYGSGEIAQHAKKLREEGYDVTAHDHHAVPGVHDENALSRQYDLVYASNVINTQNSDHALHTTLKQLRKAVKSSGTLILNLPNSPRYDAYKGLTGAQAVAKLEALLHQHFEKVLKMPGTGASPIYIIKKPRPRKKSEE